MFLQCEMGPRGDIKGNTQLFRQNDFIWTKNQILYYFILYFIFISSSERDIRMQRLLGFSPSTIFLVTSLENAGKCQRAQIPCVFMLESI